MDWRRFCLIAVSGLFVALLLPVRTAQAGIFGFGSPGTKITISPTAPSTTYTLRITLTANVTGKGSAQGVMWTASAGTITPIDNFSASYMPPYGCGVATVLAIAKADPSKTATSKVTVTAGTSPMTIQPSTATLAIPASPPTDGRPPQTIQFRVQGGTICPATF